MQLRLFLILGLGWLFMLNACRSESQEDSGKSIQPLVQEVQADSNRETLQELGLTVHWNTNFTAPASLSVSGSQGEGLVIFKKEIEGQILPDKIALRDPQGTTGLMLLDDQGRPISLEFAAHLYLFVNYTSSTVNIWLQRADGSVSLAQNVPFALGSLYRRLARLLAAQSASPDWWLLQQSGALFHQLALTLSTYLPPQAGQSFLDFGKDSAFFLRILESEASDLETSTQVIGSDASEIIATLSLPNGIQEILVPPPPSTFAPASTLPGGASHASSTTSSATSTLTGSSTFTSNTTSTTSLSSSTSPSPSSTQGSGNSTTNFPSSTLNGPPTSLPTTLPPVTLPSGGINTSPTTTTSLITTTTSPSTTSAPGPTLPPSTRLFFSPSLNQAEAGSLVIRLVGSRLPTSGVTAQIEGITCGTWSLASGFNPTTSEVLLASPVSCIVTVISGANSLTFNTPIPHSTVIHLQRNEGGGVFVTIATGRIGG